MKITNETAVGIDAIRGIGLDADNTAPTCGSAGFSVVEDTVFEGALVCVDVDGDSLTYEVTTQPGHGDVVWGVGPAFTYTPAADFFGDDEFTVEVSDGSATVVSVPVPVTVTPVGDAPTCGSAGFSVVEDTVFEGALECTDADGDTLTYAVGISPSSGTVVVGADGAFTYTPTADFSGGDEFTVEVSDGPGAVVSVPVPVTVTAVNDAPTVTNPGDQSSVKGDSVSLTVLANDVDSALLSLSFTATGLPNGLSISSAGVISGTPNTVGTFNVTVSVSDGSGGVTPASFTWVVTAAIDPPPSAPTGLSASVSTVSVRVAWAANAESDLAGYRVYRRVADGPFVELTTSPQTATSFTDSTAPTRVDLTYRVTAVDTTANESSPSPVAARRDVWFRSGSTAVNTALATSLSVPRPAGSASGDLLVTVLDVRVPASVTAPTGWVLAREDVSGSGVRQMTYYRIAGGSEPAAYSWRLSAGRGASAVSAAYGGVDPTNPLVVGSGQTSSTTSITAPSVSTTVSAALLVGAFGIVNNSALSTPTGMVRQGYIGMNATSNKVATLLTDQVAGAVGATGSRVSSAGAAAANVGHLLAFRPAPTSGVDTTKPARPTGVTASVLGSGVQVSWAANSESDLAGYRVYRSAAGGSFGLLTTSLLTTRSFTDTTAPTQGALAYRVTAVDTSSNESDPATASVVRGEVYDDAPAAGLSQITRTWAVSTVDYNNDGLQDVWLGLHANAESKLMRNNGNGTFTWVAQGTWLPRNTQGKQIDRHDCAWADVDGNGLPDAYCTVGRNSNNQVKTALIDNELWLQLTPGVFTDKGTEWGLGDPCGRGRYVAFLDANNDGWQDLFVGNDTPRNVTSDACDNPANGYPNEHAKFFINRSGNGFRAAPEWNVGLSGAGNSCAVPFDYNKDGRIDLLTCHYVSHYPYLFRNTGTGFQEVALSVGFSTGFSGAEVGDITGDGIEDLVMSDPTGFLYRVGTASGLAPAVRFANTAGGTTWGWDVAIGDIDGNGLNDIYGLVHDDALAGNPNDFVFLNKGSLQFDQRAVPSATGDGNAVAALRRTSTRNTEFIVLNGREQMDGPIQLVGMSGGAP